MRYINPRLKQKNHTDNNPYDFKIELKLKIV